MEREHKQAESMQLEKATLHQIAVMQLTHKVCPFWELYLQQARDVASA